MVLDKVRFILLVVDVDEILLVVKGTTYKPGVSQLMNYEVC